MVVDVKNEKEIMIMREAGKKLLAIMDVLGKRVAPGISTLELDKLAEELVFSMSGTPAFKGYGDKKNPFPATICASINDEIVHGVPSEEKVLKNGDILKIDIGIKYKGYFSDMARTFAVGKISNEAQNLIAAAEQCFWTGIENLKAGSKLSDYSKSVEKYISGTSYSIVRNLVGHGIGKQLHENPQVPNLFDRSLPDFVLQSGNTLALEPMINEGVCENFVGSDDWVFKTADGKLSAHYENTVLITKDGVEVLTV